MMSKNYQETLELVAQIEKYLEYESDSHQEAVALMCRLASYPDYVADELYNVLVKELEDELKNYQENAEIVETRKSITVYEADLVWKNE